MPEALNPILIQGRPYQNVKSYVGLANLPSFALQPSIRPTFDLSRNVDPAHELEFNTVIAPKQGLPAGGPYSPNDFFPYVLPCPEGTEHIYTRLSFQFDLSKSAIQGGRFAVYVASEAAIPTSLFGFSVNPDPSFIPNLVLVFASPASLTYTILDKTQLPIYVPPKGFLVIWPFTLNVDALTAPNYYIQYKRIKRIAGLGPLVK